MDQALNSTSTQVAEEAHKDDRKKEELQKMISGLPREMGLSHNDGGLLYKYQGFWYSPGIIENILTQPPSLLWNLSPSDVLLCCNPKCGTTWLKALAFAIATRTRYPQGAESSPLLATLPHYLIPSIEFTTPARSEIDHTLPLFSTHMPYSFLPKSVLECGCKMVYICRDPKDAFVSRLHFFQKIRANNNNNNNSTSTPMPTPTPTIDQSAVDLFCRGVTPFGPHWDHVLGYWEVSLERPEKVLFLRYEDMVRDPVSQVIRLAGFMGYGFSPEEERRGVPGSVVEMCSFDRLSNLEVNKSNNGKGTMVFKGTHVTNDSFFRKGEVGDWRNYLTPQMADKIDQITTEKLGPNFLL